MDNTMNANPHTDGLGSGAATAGSPSPPRSSAARGDSVGGLLSDLWRHSTTLVQGEVDLAKAEMSEKLTQVMVSIGAIAVGGAVLFGGFIVLLMACVNALIPLLPPDISAWAAPAIVGLVVIVIGFVMVTAGLKALQAHNLAPKRTVESLRKDKEMVKEHV